MPELDLAVRFIRFGVFEVDLQAGELRKGGIRLKLPGQPFVLLVTLLKRQGELVTREELRDTLWPDGTFVDFDHSLRTAVNKLREVLGDSATTPRFVETLPKRGYRFVAPISVVTERDSPTTPVDLPHRNGASLWKIASVALLMASLAFFVNRKLGSPATPAIRSLAVLPLTNLSSDPGQDYFSDGMTDELITELGQIGELRVISRTSVMSYKNVHKALPQIARELNVDAVVEGTVLREGNHIRITAQLIDAASDRQLWAQRYEGEIRNVLVLQNQVAHSIAGQVRIKLNSPQRKLTSGREVTPEAHEALLKGRYFWNKRTASDLKKALEFFNLATEKDPEFAQAYSGLADTFALMGDWEYGVMAPKDAFPKARAAATKALALDNTLGEAHTSLAFALDLYDWDWEAAEKEYVKAVQFSPNYATAHQWYAWHLLTLGRNEEAVAEMKKAEGLDPLSLIISADKADLLFTARRFEDSIEQSRATLAMDSRFSVAHDQLGQALGQKQLFPEAIGELQQAVALSGGNPTFTSHLAYLYARSGQADKAMEMLKTLQNASNASAVALVYVGLGEKERALDWLEKAYDERFNPSVLLRPTFDPIRGTRRFQNLLRRIGLAQ